MDAERKELAEIKALVLTLATALTGLLATLSKIFKTMALDRFPVELIRCDPHFSHIFMRFLLRPSSTCLVARLRGPKSGPHESARKLCASLESLQLENGLVFSVVLLALLATLAWLMLF